MVEDPMKDGEVKKKVDAFFANYPLHTIDKSQLLIFAGENPAGIFYLVEGLVRQYAVSVSGSEVVINIFKPPAFFPMNWAINKAPNKYFFQSVGQIKFHRAPVEDTLKFMKENPDVTFDLLGRLYSGVDGLLERTVYFMTGPALNRLAVEIVISCKRFGDKQADGTYKLKVSQQELANRTGLSRETVSRDLPHLPYVEVNRGSVRVTDLTGLEKYLSDNS